MAAPIRKLCPEYPSLHFPPHSSTVFTSTTKPACVSGFPDVYWNRLKLPVEGMVCSPDLIKPKKPRVAAAQSIFASIPPSEAPQLVLRTSITSTVIGFLHLCFFPCSAQPAPTSPLPPSLGHLIRLHLHLPLCCQLSLYASMHYPLPCQKCHKLTQACLQCREGRPPIPLTKYLRFIHMTLP